MKDGMSQGLENQDSEMRQMARNRRKSDHDAKVRGIRIRALNAAMVVLALFVSIVFLQAANHARDAYQELEASTETYIACENAASDMKTTSNYLANLARSFVATRDQSYAERYFEELNVDDRRGQSIKTLQENLGSEAAQEDLELAMLHSDALTDRELYAMKLAAVSEGMELEGLLSQLNDVQLSPQDARLSAADQAERAESLLFESDYDEYLNLISQDVDNCKADLVAEIEAVQAAGEANLDSLLFQQQALTIALLLVVVVMIVLFTALILRPLSVYSAHISRNGELPLKGAYELRYLAQAYNIVFEENQFIHEQLLNRAERDHLTGLYNRSVFERAIASHMGTPLALLLIDADYFKSVNDTLGHDAGDAMLQKVARLLTGTFRLTDYPCRIGGDEFAVIMTDIGPELKRVVQERIQTVRDGLADTSDGLPVMTLSVGVAFSDGQLDSDQLYKNADKALYVVKEAGRNGLRFFDELSD